MVTSDIALGGQRVYIYGNDMLGHLRFSRGIGSGTPTVSRFYYLKDHLGSIRMTMSRSGRVVSHDDYYPYGTIMDGRSMNMGQGDERFKFTGKELDVETGYEYFGARSYDAERGQWPCGDILVNLSSGWTPYRYGYDNPIRFYDPDGLTEKERIKMVEKGNSLIGTARGTAMSGLVGKNKMDCGVVIRLAALYAGLKDPVIYGLGLGEGNTNSVARIASFGRKNSLGNARIGDVAIFNTGNGDYTHVGQITQILSTDENGNVTNFEFIHCGGSVDAGKVTHDELSRVTGFKKTAWKLTGVYQIDTPDNENSSMMSSGNTVLSGDQWWKTFAKQMFGNGKSAQEMYNEINRGN